MAARVSGRSMGCGRRIEAQFTGRAGRGSSRTSRSSIVPGGAQWQRALWTQRKGGSLRSRPPPISCGADAGGSCWPPAPVQPRGQRRRPCDGVCLRRWPRLARQGRRRLRRDTSPRARQRGDARRRRPRRSSPPLRDAKAPSSNGVVATLTTTSQQGPSRLDEHRTRVSVALFGDGPQATLRGPACRRLGRDQTEIRADGVGALEAPRVVEHGEEGRSDNETDAWRRGAELDERVVFRQQLELVVDVCQLLVDPFQGGRQRCNKHSHWLRKRRRSKALEEVVRRA